MISLIQEETPKTFRLIDDNGDEMPDRAAAGKINDFFANMGRSYLKK